MSIIKNSFKEYQAIDAINSSRLKDFIDSEAYFRDKHITKRIKDEDTDNFIFGRATHSYILEPENFANEFIVGEKRKNTKEGKFNWAIAVKEGKAVISQDDFELIKYFKEELPKYQNWSGLNGKGKHYNEITILVKDPITGLNLKMRADKLIDLPNIVFILDLKTTIEHSYEKLEKTMGDYQYSNQNSFYRKVAHIEFSKPVLLIDVFLSKARNNEIAFVQENEDDQVLADEVTYHALNRYKECLNTNTWQQHFKDEIKTISLKPWHREKMSKYIERYQQ